MLKKLTPRHRAKMPPKETKKEKKNLSFQLKNDEDYLIFPTN